jgi:hypothetical protein
MSQNDTATPRWARRSAVCDRVRDPVNRHTTMTLARPSTALPSAQPVSAIEPAVRPCHSPTAPSMPIQARPIQASARAQRAARCHPASRTTGIASVELDEAQRSSSNDLGGMRAALRGCACDRSAISSPWAPAPMVWAAIGESDRPPVVV